MAQGAHGVGRAQVGAGAAAGAGRILQRHVFRLRDLPGGEHAVGLRGGGLVGLAAIELNAALHGAAGQQDAGNVQPCRRHQHTGDDLIAGAQQHQAVKQVDLGHALDGVGDQFPGGQDIVHTAMAVGHAVAAADHAELDGRAAGAVNAVLDPLGHLPQVIVAGDTLAPRVGDANDRPLQVLRGKAHGF